MRKLVAVLISVMLISAVSGVRYDIVIAGNSSVDQMAVKGAGDMTLSIPNIPDASFIDVAVKADGSAAYATYNSAQGSGTAIFNMSTGAYVGDLPSTCALATENGDR